MICRAETHENIYFFFFECCLHIKVQSGRWIENGWDSKTCLCWKLFSDKWLFESSYTWAFRKSSFIHLSTVYCWIEHCLIQTCIVLLDVRSDSSVLYVAEAVWYICHVCEYMYSKMRHEFLGSTRKSLFKNSPKIGKMKICELYKNKKPK